MFNSKKQKIEKDYRYLTEVLKSSNIDTKEKVEEQLQKVNSKAIYATVILLVIIGALSLLFNKYYPIWGIIGIMCLAWIWRSAITAKQIMLRYIEEEINTNNH